MKHGELIKAAVDGKTIQWKYRIDGWIDFNRQAQAIATMAHDVSNTEYRIKPEPIPDKVTYGVVNTLKGNTSFIDVDYVRATYHRSLRDGLKLLVKLTLKTDENGVVTEHVEIMK